VSEADLELARAVFPGPLDLISIFGDDAAVGALWGGLDSLVDPELVVFAPPGLMPVPGLPSPRDGDDRPYAVGLDGMVAAYRDWLSAFERWVVTPVDYLDLGEGRVLIDVEIEMRSKTAGVEVTTEGSNLLTIRDGKLTRLESFLSRAEAREAAGLAS
jgi:hypothetical protein